MYSVRRSEAWRTPRHSTLAAPASRHRLMCRLPCQCDRRQFMTVFMTATQNSYDIHRPAVARRCRSNSYITKPLVTLTMPTLVVVVLDRYLSQLPSHLSRTQASAYTAQTVAKCTEFAPPRCPRTNPNYNPTLHSLATIF